MAVLAAAALLDELMGRNRNVAPTEKTKELNWEDPEYCKYYMVKFCPHDLFVNTRADLGACAKVHDDEVKALFANSISYKKQAYEDEFIRFSQGMLNEVERKIVKGKQRLALIGKSEPPTSLSPAQTQRNMEQIALLSEKINSLVNEAEAAGIQGNVEQAQGLMKLCDQLKEEREMLRKQNDNNHWTQTAELAAAQEKQMEVCEVCGAFLIVGDAQSRIDDHLMGKQHVGYAKLRSALEEIMAIRAKQRDEKEKKREEERKERYRAREEEEKKREKEREERRKKREEEESKKRHRSRSPHHNNSRKDRDHDRDRDRDRYRDYDRDRVRDRDRDSRSNSRRDDRNHRNSYRNHSSHRSRSAHRSRSRDKERSHHGDSDRRRGERESSRR